MIEKSGQIFKKSDTSFEKTLEKIEACINKNSVEGLKLEDSQMTIQSIFDIFSLIREKANISSRLKSLIINLEALKNDGWALSKLKNDGPKTIEQVHRERDE